MSDVEVVNGRWLIIRPAGEIDFSNAEELDAVLNASVEKSPRGFVIDLSETTYFDSAGVRSILYALKHLYAAGGRLALVVRTDNIHKLLDTLNLEQVPGIIVCESVEAAEEALSAGV